MTTTTTTTTTVQDLKVNCFDCNSDWWFFHDDQHDPTQDALVQQNLPWNVSEGFSFMETNFENYEDRGHYCLSCKEFVDPQISAEYYKKSKEQKKAEKAAKKAAKKACPKCVKCKKCKACCPACKCKPCSIGQYYNYYVGYLLLIFIVVFLYYIFVLSYATIHPPIKLIMKNTLGMMEKKIKEKQMNPSPLSYPPPPYNSPYSYTPVPTFDSRPPPPPYIQ